MRRKISNKMKGLFLTILAFNKVPISQSPAPESWTMAKAKTPKSIMRTVLLLNMATKMSVQVP